MKKLTAVSALFLFVFGLAAGLTVTLHQDAFAIEQCAYKCLFKIERSDDTGPLCPSPSLPYYLWKKSTCAGGPLDCPNIQQVIGCCPSPDPGVGICNLILQ